ncbi:MAG: hypothetical protein HY606_09100 [Planctomycetes bacterium]|nr:hypothetical protein [Planctomycetota bacterium]
MSNDRKSFEIKPALDLLRASIGDSEFGYRMQAFFAHVLLELGGSIIEINQQGHPDIKWNFNGKTSLIQVKTTTHSNVGWCLTISPDDIAGIRPSGLNEVGYFAVLDCAVPISWLISEYDKIRRHESRSVNIETIRTAINLDFSNEFTAVFTELMTMHKERLYMLTYAILRERALRGEGL